MKKNPFDKQAFKETVSSFIMNKQLIKNIFFDKKQT